MKVRFRSYARRTTNVLIASSIASALVLSSGVALSQGWGNDRDDPDDEEEYSAPRRRSAKKPRSRAMMVPDQATSITITSTWAHTTLLRLSGVGTGTVATHTTSYSPTGGTVVSPGYATVQMAHLNTLCETPCTITVPAGAYAVSGPGMNSRSFYVPQSDDHLELHVEAAPEWPKTLSTWSIYIGITAAVTGGTLWMLNNAMDSEYTPKSDNTPYQIITFAGLGLTLGGIIGLIVSNSTHVYGDNGELLDAKAKQTRQVGKLRFSPSGLLF